MENEELELLYEKYAKSLFLYALSLTGNRDDAEDLVQNTFLKALLSYENKGSIRFWLSKVLKNEFLNQQKRKKRLVDEGKIPLESLRQESMLLENIIQDEERRMLLEAIMQLPLIQKNVLLDSIYLSLSDEEIAAGNQISCENVRQIRSRAKRKLINMLKEVQ